MFDVGFWEIALITVVALLVVGPERLPGLARKVGLWVGKIRRFVSSVQSEIDQELSKAEQLKKLIEDQKELFAKHQIIDDEKPTVPVEPKLAKDKDPTSIAVDDKRRTHKDSDPAVAVNVHTDESHHDEADDEFSHYPHNDEADEQSNQPDLDQKKDPLSNLANGSHEKTNS